MKKYEFTGVTVNHFGRRLHQIKRLSDGLIGGYIESERNLSHDGDCFVSGNARVFGNAIVCGNAEAFDNARVFGNAQVSGNAQVFGNAKVSGNAVATGLVQHIVTYKHDITLTDNHIQIGCECHTIEHWKENIADIGKANDYSDKEIKNIKRAIKFLLQQRKLNEEN
jgi:hypothetical protein